MNPSHIEFSIIIPTKNEANFLYICLDSIKNANLSNYEIIVVDNFSEDNTVKIAQKFGCNVIKNKKQGAASSRNLGAKAAIGKLLAFIDADCKIHENWFNILAEHFADPKIVAAGTKVSPDFANATWVEVTSFHLNQRRGINISENIRKVKWLGTSNLMIRKEIFDKIGGFNNDLITAEDYDLCERLNMHGDLIIDKRIYTIHLREDKTLKELFIKERWRGQGSFNHWLENGFSFYEAPSVLIPLFFFFLQTVGLIYLIFNSQIGAVLLLMSLFAPTLMVLRTIESVSINLSFLQSLAVSYVYLFARGSIIIDDIFTYIGKKIKRIT